MTRLISRGLLAALLCAPALAAGQSSGSVPAPAQSTAPAAGSAPAQQPAATLHANANLVVVDVVVSDAQHNPVHKLAQSDFTILENGHPQTIKNFEEHTAAEAAAPLPPMPKLPAGTFTNYTNAPAAGPLNVLLLDTLNTPMNSQAVVREQVLKFLKESRPGARMAIFGLTTRLILLQGFTSDPERLRAVLNGKKGLPKGSSIMTNAVSGDTVGADDPMMDTLQDVLGNDPSAAQLIANLQQFEAQAQSFQLQLRARYTLDAFNQLARYLSNLPGRKNLIWFSGSFPLNILPDGDLQNPFAVVASSEDEFRETTDLLSRAQVAVYPIDARGLMTQPMLSVENSGSKYARTPSAFAKDSNKFFQQTADEHGAMDAMAQATGGRSFVNTNGLKEAVQKAIDAGANYYTLSYTPADAKWKGEYRKIQVQMAHSGLNLAYRRGYFADDPYAAPRHGQAPAPAANAPAPYSAMRTAMMRGGPDPTQVTFEAMVRPSSAAAEPDPAPGNKPNPKVSGPWRRYTVLFAVSPGDIDCPATPDGVRHCAFEALIFVYDADGVLLNTQGAGGKIDLPADQYPAFLHSGLRFRQQIAVPAKGESFLRIGVHDTTTDHVGAVEIPVSAVAKLPPLPEATGK